jgi:hypothetical protein
MSDSSATDDDKIITHLEWRSNNIIEKLNNSIKILNDDKNDDLQSLTIYVVSIEDDIHYILENIKNIGVKNKLIDTIASDDVPGKQFLNNMEIILNNYNVITLLEQLDIYIKKISQNIKITSRKNIFREQEIKILTDIIKSEEKIVSEIQEIYQIYNDIKQSTSTVAPENGGGKRKSKRKYTKKQKKSRRARKTRK